MASGEPRARPKNAWRGGVFSGQPAPAASNARDRRTRNRRLIIAGGVIAAVLLVVIFVVVAVVLLNSVESGADSLGEETSSPAYDLADSVTASKRQASVALSSLIAPDRLAFNNSVFRKKEPVNKLTQRIHAVIEANYNITAAESYAQLVDWGSDEDDQIVRLALLNERIGNVTFHCRRAHSPVQLSVGFAFYMLEDYHASVEFQPSDDLLDRQELCDCTGQVEGQEDSSVELNLCGRLFGLIEYDNGTQLHVQSLPNETTLVIVASSADERVVNDEGELLKQWEGMFRGDVDFIALPEAEAYSVDAGQWSGPCSSADDCEVKSRWARGVRPPGDQVEHFQKIPRYLNGLYDYGVDELLNQWLDVQFVLDKAFVERCGSRREAWRRLASALQWARARVREQLCIDIAASSVVFLPPKVPFEGYRVDLLKSMCSYFRDKERANDTKPDLIVLVSGLPTVGSIGRSIYGSICSRYSCAIVYDLFTSAIQLPYTLLHADIGIHCGCDDPDRQCIMSHVASNATRHGRRKHFSHLSKFGFTRVPVDNKAMQQWLHGEHYEGKGAFLQSRNRIFKAFLEEDGNLCVMAADRSFNVTCLNSTRRHHGRGEEEETDGAYRVQYMASGKLCFSQRLASGKLLTNYACINLHKCDKSKSIVEPLELTNNGTLRAYLARADGTRIGTFWTPFCMLPKENETHHANGSVKLVPSTTTTEPEWFSTTEEEAAAGSGDEAAEEEEAMKVVDRVQMQGIVFEDDPKLWGKGEPLLGTTERLDNDSPLEQELRFNASVEYETSLEWTLEAGIAIGVSSKLHIAIVLPSPLPELGIGTTFAWELYVKGDIVIGDTSKETRAWSIEVVVAVPPNSHLTAQALGWSKKATTRWHSPRIIADLTDGRKVSVDEYAGEVTGRIGEHFRILYHCWKDGEGGKELPCDKQHKVVKVLGEEGELPYLKYSLDNKTDV